MASELLPVASALGGVLTGGFINYFAMRSVKNYEWKLALAKEQMASRQKLYAEFLVEAQRLVVQAIERKIAGATELHTMYGKFAEISLVASEAVVDSARAVADYALASHSPDGPSESSNFFSLKQAFIDAARKDIASVCET
jgi:hypothetical protein